MDEAVAVILGHDGGGSASPFLQFMNFLFLFFSFYFKWIGWNHSVYPPPPLDSQYDSLGFYEVGPTRSNLKIANQTPVMGMESEL